MFNKFSRFEEPFAQWQSDGYSGVKPETYKYIDFLSDPNDDHSPRPGTLWPHQWESFLRVIYAHEVLGQKEVGANGFLLNIVTGGGKTAVIAALIAWLRIAHNVQKFLLLCPNLIVRDRLEDDFEQGKVFASRDLLPEWSNMPPKNFILTTLGGNGGGWHNLFSSDVILGNIHQFYTSNKSGWSNLSGLLNGPDFALFNDEAHNSPAEEYDNTLKRLAEKVVLRVDTTATPDRADGRSPDSDMTYEYGVGDALADAVIKTPVVYQPDIKTVQLTYTDARTGQKKTVEEIDWDEVDRLGLTATQWVTDDEPMRQQMAVALNRLAEQERRAKGRYQPILFVIAVCKADAEKAEHTLNHYFKVKTLLVTEDSDEDDRRKARELGREQRGAKPYRAVVSVLMLREGWDVPEVGVILLLRKFSSKVYGQQVVGRGLRRVRAKQVDASEPQICAVVDHPKLEHQWLWDLFGKIRVRGNVLIDQTFDETEDLPEPPPKQELTKPQNVIELPDPDPSLVDGGEFDVGDLPPPPQPRRDWREVLAGLVYDETAVEITRLGIAGVRGRELAPKGWTTIQESPDVPSPDPAAPYSPSDDALRDQIKEALIDYAEDLAVVAGYAGTIKSNVYSALVSHVRQKFLDGTSLGLASRPQLDFARKMLPKVRHAVAGVPGLIAGIIEYADQ